MQVGDCGDQTQTQAGTWSRPTGVEPVEALEDLLTLFGWDAVSVVGHREADLIALTRHAHRDAPARRDIFQRIVDQIGDSLEH